MKTPDADPLFDALRDRLADHGHAPPPQLWGRIRAQLPPPVARFRRRRWGAGWLLALLLIIGVGGFWALPKRRAARTTSRPTAVLSGPNAVGNAVAAAKNASHQAATRLAAAEGTSNRVGGRPAIGAGTSDRVGGRPAIGVSTSNPVGGRPAIGVSTSNPIGGRPAIGAGTSNPVGGRPAIGACTSDRVGDRPAIGVSTSDRVGGRLVIGAGTSDRLTTRPVAAGTAPAFLTARAVALRLLPLAVPAPVAPGPLAVPPSPPPRPLGGRWAVQVLAGPALTYRTLGAAPQLAGTVATVPTPGTAPLERPALGSGAQVSVRRQLSAHWSARLGLGYADYGAELRLRLVSAPAATPRDSAVQHRDSYRFLTVPVQVGYGWQPTGRWHLGLLAGADALLYLGGSTTEGSPCACQTQPWGATGSPYRPLSLGLRLGAEARYRVGERWELLAQPTASYLLTPLLKADADLYPRQLWGGAALLGVSYDLP